MKRGLVSVTFRQLPCEEIIRLCRENGLSYIEWGGDIHVPAGDTEKAAEVAGLCRAAGVTPLGYGSYYNASDDFARFQPVLDTARALGAGYVRIWAGKSREYDRTAEENIKKAVLEASGEAAPYNGLPANRSINTQKAQGLGFKFYDLESWLYKLIDWELSR